MVDLIFSQSFDHSTIKFTNTGVSPEIVSISLKSSVVFTSTNWMLLLKSIFILALPIVLLLLLLLLIS